MISAMYRIDWRMADMTAWATDVRPEADISAFAPAI
jgi:hypothetical protein